MKTWSGLRFLLAGLVFLMAALGAPTVLGCAACFGKSDSAMAQGMNMGIFSLLVVVVCVLAAVASFFVYLARRSARMAALPGARGMELTTRS